MSSEQDIERELDTWLPERQLSGVTRADLSSGVDSAIFEKRHEGVVDQWVEDVRLWVEKGWTLYAKQRYGKALLLAVCAWDRAFGFPHFRMIGPPEQLDREEWKRLRGPFGHTGKLAANLASLVRAADNYHEVEHLKPCLERFAWLAGEKPQETVWRAVPDHFTRPGRRELVADALEAAETFARLNLGLFQREATYTLGENFDRSKLQEMFEKRERQGRSLQVIIVARDNDTGTGKTTLAVQLCKRWDPEWSAEFATNRPGEYRDFLNNKPEGSVLLADEIGQMYDSRRSMSSENVAVSQDWQMIRTKEYKTVSTLPGPSFLDKRLKKLADIIIVATRRGHARVYRLKVDDESGDLWREHLHNVEWGPLDDDPDYQEIEEMKRERLRERFEGGDEDDDDDELSDEERRRVRNQLIEEMVENGLTQKEVAQGVGLTPAAVSQILRD